MKLVIDRVMFWFNDINELTFLNHKFASVGNLLTRLLSDNYNGKKIKYLNIEFYSNPDSLIKAYGTNYLLHFYGGHLVYKKVIDLKSFFTLNFQEQKKFIWKEGYEMLQYAAKELKNNSLIESSEYAYHKGLELDLVADYRMIDEQVILYGENYRASLWVNFLEDKMEANFTLEKEDKIVFKKFIGEAPNGMEFFFVMFKKIEQKNNSIIIKGLKDVEYLPFKISFNENLEEVK